MAGQLVSNAVFKELARTVRLRLQRRRFFWIVSRVKIQRALLSVSDKTGLVPFAQILAAQGVELIVLPENFALMARDDAERVAAGEVDGGQR